MFRSASSASFCWLMPLAMRSRRMLSPNCFSQGDRILDFATDTSFSEILLDAYGVCAVISIQIMGKKWMENLPEREEARPATAARGSELATSTGQLITNDSEVLPSGLPSKSSVCKRSSCYRGSYFSLTRLRDNLIRKAGPNFFMLTFAGNSSSTRAPKTFAKTKSSPSGTRRCWVSNLAKDSLLTSQPEIWSFPARSDCVHPLRSRNFRTCAPTRFSGSGFVITRNRSNFRRHSLFDSGHIFPC